ncbi:cytochrome P450 94B3-like [Juglans microcarpa x Juglans regia]|uniref:cytochrome P450 94B3-like n=1 Tax=Juglans microcarpa x Juglans regia TaxID=2249226 RepID=UPI001B7DB203|nr:cytochrome P450 94B3-like [Juglans microcarpa x Juglans regia]
MGVVIFIMSIYTLKPLTFMFLPIILYLFHVILRELWRVRKLSGHGPPTYPIIGCLISFYKNRNHLLDWYTELLTESATNTIVVHRFGAPRTIVTANPENVEYMLKTNFNNFPKGKRFTEILGDFLGCGIFNVDGALWRSQRKLASHEFSAKSLREFAMNTLEEEVEKQLLPLLESLAAAKEVVDLQELLRRLAFNMVCEVSLGIDRFCLDPSQPISPLAKAFDMASEVCARRGAAPLFIVWKIKRWLGLGSEQKLKDAVEEVHAYVNDIIQHRKQKMNQGDQVCSEDDLLSRFISAGHEDEIIRDMMISFIMAGRDTTSAAMTWFFWLLSCHPDTEQEVLKEIESVGGDPEMLDYESLKELRLLKACLCESMRLYPPVAWDSKHAMVNDLLPDGTPVNAGDRLTYFPYGMGRMEALWGKDRLEFKPDRWFLELDKERSGALKEVCPYKFPIFQAGPRVCLGKEMAFTQMKYVVASILRRFEFRPVGSESPLFVPLLTAHMAGGFKVLVHRRR